MSLRAKIDHFIPTMKHFSWNELNCHERIKNILVSSDYKYFFVCKLYIDSHRGIGRYLIQIYDLPAKKWINTWQTKGKSYTNLENMKENQQKQQELRGWMMRYPESILNTWRFS